MAENGTSGAGAPELRNRILTGDCRAILRSLPDCLADLVFADPPYNLQLGGELLRPDNSRVAGVEEAWDRFADYQTYDDFCRDWLGQCRRVLKENGSLWVIGSYHNIFRLGTILQDLGFWILNDVVWRKANPMPNFRGRRFTNAHETLIWAARSKEARYFFNYEAMKSLNDDQQMRSDWLFPLCTGAERLKLEDGSKAHPTQKPEALLRRILMASTRPGDLVLDPFFGSGTTGAAARQLGRDYLGLEADARYVAMAQARLDAIAPLPPESLAGTPSRRDLPRVPFGWLIEAGKLRPGDRLYGPDPRFTATVRADGTLRARNALGDHQGSIHQVAAALQNAAACNGWTFWSVKTNGAMVPIDRFRQELRREQILFGDERRAAPPSA